MSHDRDFLDRVASGVLVAEGDGAWQDYAGGYTDMVAQRGEGLTGRAAVEPVREARSPEAKPAIKPLAVKEKLSFKDKHALEQIPKTIASLEAKRARLRVTLDDPGLYARDPAGFAKQTDAFAKLEAEIARAEEEWLAIEMRREAMDG